MTAQPRRWLILAVLATTLLVIAMDATILNVALPTIATDLRAGSTELLWIVDAYGLVLAGLLIAAAALADRLGRRRVLSAGLVLFAAASLAAALAPSPEALIAARGLLGVAGALIMPSALSVLRAVFLDDRERAVAVGVWSAIAAAGFAVGPIVGGALLEVVDWHWLFALQAPVVVLSLVAVRRTVPESRDPRPGAWDPVGVALSVGGMLALVWGIKGLGKDGLGDVGALVVLAAGLGALAAFVVQQARRPRPMVDVRLFADRRFAASAVAVLFVFVGLAGLLLLLTQYLQLVQGHGPLAAGLRLLPLALAALVAAPATDALVRRVGARVAVGGGFAVVALAFAALAGLDAGTPYLVVAASLAAMGAGAGVASTAASAAILSAAPPERAGGAVAIQETAYELGGALGVALLGSLMTAAYRAGLDTADAPGAAIAVAREGLPAAAEAAAQAGGAAGGALLAAAQAAFLDGFAVTAVASAVVMGAVAAVAFVLMPRGDVARQ